MKTIIIGLAAFLSLQGRAEGIPGMQLLSYFQSSCGSQGEYTQAALDDSESLIKVLRSLAEDDDCRSIAGHLGNLNNVHYNLGALKHRTGVDMDLAVIEAQEVELSAQLIATVDPTVRAELEASMRSLQIEKAGLIGERGSLNRVDSEELSGIYAHMVNTSNSFLSQLNANQRCLYKSPAILPAASQLVGSIGRVVSNVNPAIGMGLSAAAELFQGIVEYARAYKLERQIRKASDRSIATEAYKCAMETLGDRWCEIDDAEKFLQFKMGLSEVPAEGQDDVLAVVRLNDREIPALLDWLNKLRAGVDPSNGSDGGRLKIAILNEASVRANQKEGIGIIKEYRFLYDQAGTSELNKWLALKRVIKKLMSAFGGNMMNSDGSSAGGPMFDIHSGAEAPYILLGLAGQPIINGNPLSFDVYNPVTMEPKPPGGLSYDVLIREFEEWVAKASDSAQAELTNVLQPNGLLTLTNAYRRANNPWKISPEKALRNLVHYMEKHRPEQLVDSAFKKVFRETSDNLKYMHVKLESVIHGDEDDSKVILAKIFTKAGLENGTGQMQTALEIIAESILQDRILSASPEEQNVAAQLLVADSFARTLTKMSGRDNLTMIARDLQRAKGIALSNMESFVRVFGDHIEDLVEESHKRSLVREPDLAQVDRMDLAEMCLFLATMPEWPKDVPFEFCQGTQLPAIKKGGPKSPKLTPAFIKSGFSKRSCAFRDYIRKSRIYDKWNVRF